MRTLTIERIFEILAYIIAVSSFVRLVLHWLRDALIIWIPFNPERPNGFWRFYDKFEATVAYVALSLGKYGKKEALLDKLSQELREKQK